MIRPANSDAIYRVALAGVCMSHGLRPQDAVALDNWLTQQTPVWTVEDTFLLLEQGVMHVKRERDRAQGRRNAHDPS